MQSPDVISGYPEPRHQRCPGVQLNETYPENVQSDVISYSNRGIRLVAFRLEEACRWHSVDLLEVVSSDDEKNIFPTFV